MNQAIEKPVGNLQQLLAIALSKRDVSSHPQQGRQQHLTDGFALDATMGGMEGGVHIDEGKGSIMQGEDLIAHTLDPNHHKTS